VIWGEHDGVLRTAILALKHRSHDELAQPLGERLAALVGIQPWAPSIDAVCGVPSHPVRSIRRRWSASELVAGTVARALDIRLLRPLRRRTWRRQTGRSRADRLRLPARSFGATAAARHRRVLLVDDVTTTGTTLRRACEALLGAGAKTVFCAVAAHSPDPRSTP
jgi:predicted amidophosphoribosyltransferase